MNIPFPPTFLYVIYILSNSSVNCSGIIYYEALLLVSVHLGLVSPLDELTICRYKVIFTPVKYSLL